MIRGTEDRARTAIKLIEEQGYSVRQACKECNISKAFLKDVQRKQQAIRRFDKILEQVKKEKIKHNEFEIGELPSLASPVIEFEENLDLQLEEEDTEMEQQNLFSNAAQHEQAMEALKTKFEREVNLAIALAKYRYSKKMTQDEFAKICGIGASTLAQYESGTVEVSQNKRQVRMVFARINMTEDELIEKWSNKEIPTPKKTQGFINIKRNVATRLNYYIPELEEEAKPAVEDPEEDKIKKQAEEIVFERSAQEAKIQELEQQIEDLKFKNRHMAAIQQGSDKRRAAVEKEKEELEASIAPLKAALKDKDNIIASLRNELSVAKQPDVKANKEALEIIQTKDAKIKELQRTIKRYELIIDRQFVGEE